MDLRYRQRESPRRAAHCPRAGFVSLAIREAPFRCRHCATTGSPSLHPSGVFRRPGPQSPGASGCIQRPCSRRGLRRTRRRARLRSRFRHPRRVGPGQLPLRGFPLREPFRTRPAASGSGPFGPSLFAAGKYFSDSFRPAQYPRGKLQGKTGKSGTSGLLEPPKRPRLRPRSTFRTPVAPPLAPQGRFRRPPNARLYHSSAVRALRAGAKDC